MILVNRLSNGKKVGILADIFEKKGKELAPLSRQAPFFMDKSVRLNS